MRGFKSGRVKLQRFTALCLYFCQKKYVIYRIALLVQLHILVSLFHSGRICNRYSAAKYSCDLNHSCEHMQVLIYVVHTFYPSQQHPSPPNMYRTQIVTLISVLYKRYSIIILTVSPCKSRDYCSKRFVFIESSILKV